MKFMLTPADNDGTILVLRYAPQSSWAVRAFFFGGADLFQEGSFDQAFAGCDAVVHTAAIVEVLSQKDAQKTVVDPSYGICAALTSSDQAFTAHGFGAECKGHKTW